MVIGDFPLASRRSRMQSYMMTLPTQNVIGTRLQIDF
jgi:hypothetical protein